MHFLESNEYFGHRTTNNIIPPISQTVRDRRVRLFPCQEWVNLGGPCLESSAWQAKSRDTSGNLYGHLGRRNGVYHRKTAGVHSRRCCLEERNQESASDAEWLNDKLVGTLYKPIITTYQPFGALCHSTNLLVLSTSFLGSYQPIGTI